MGTAGIEPSWRPLRKELQIAVGCAVAALVAVAPAPALAQTLRIVPTIDARVAASNNIEFATDARAQDDVVVDLFPQISISGQTARLRVNGTLGVSLVGYVNRSLRNRVLPRADLGATATLIDRFLFLEGQATADRTVADPLSATPGGETSYNVLSSIRTRLSPYIDYRPTPNVQFYARSDSSLIRQSGSTLTAADINRDATVQQRLVRLQRLPVPLGFVAEARSQDSRLLDSDPGSGLKTAAARLTVTYAPAPELVIGLRGGRETSKFTLEDVSEPLYGGTLQWTPSERTSLRFEGEDRYFGRGWLADIRHRSPFLALTARSERTPTTSPLSLALLGAGGDLAGLLDSILSTRVIDPVARAAQVQDILRSRGLSATVGRPLEIFSESAQLSQSNEFIASLFGVRHVVTLSVFLRKATNLTIEGGQVIGAPVSSNRQDGGSFEISRRLTPLDSVDVRIDGLRVRIVTRPTGATSDAEQSSVNKSVRLSYTRTLSTNTSATFGFRRQLLNASTGSNAQETTAFAGLSHRF
jgi:uncharacterized protein (PEP-CTERM system associated)